MTPERARKTHKSQKEPHKARESEKETREDQGEPGGAKEGQGGPERPPDRRLVLCLASEEQSQGGPGRPPDRRLVSVWQQQSRARSQISEVFGIQRRPEGSQGTRQIID